ncbi:MAG: hypothetical protein ACLFS3_03020 [Candidatus Aenigmatarchaeota archaeon]
MAWLCKKAFSGKIPFPVIYIDTGFHFRDEMAEKWDLDMIVARNEGWDNFDGVGLGKDCKSRLNPFN